METGVRTAHLLTLTAQDNSRVSNLNHSDLNGRYYNSDYMDTGPLDPYVSHLGLSNTLPLEITIIDPKRRRTTTVQDTSDLLFLASPNEDSNGSLNSTSAGLDFQARNSP